MGILDKKTRLFDTILTQEGRWQLAHGNFKPAFYSFTDMGIVYEKDAVSGSSSTNNVFAFEACNLPQDQVVFEADDSGKLSAYRGSNMSVINGQILSGSTPGSVLMNEAFASAATSLLSSSVDNFTRLQILRSPDPFDDTQNFVINKEQITITFTDEFPIPSGSVNSVQVNDAESLFMDKRLSHIPNFAHLPPVNKGDKSSFGNFPALNQAPILNFDQLNNEFETLRRQGMEEIIEFSESSLQNNIIGQFFELTNNQLTKLDVIDFGSFVVEDGTDFPKKHVFFVGKLFIDDYGTDVFINLFSLVFES
jgi:hypothetical protein